jgi:hypothetical protein
MGTMKALSRGGREITRKFARNILLIDVAVF